jgi:hypothetical protein
MRALGLGWLLVALVGCHSPQVIVITNYAQADKLVANYLRQPIQQKLAWIGLPAAPTYLLHTGSLKESILV